MCEYAWFPLSQTLYAMPSLPPSVDPTALRLELLGDASLATAAKGDARGVGLTAGKPLALLAFLHCAPAHSASREQLLELLWSDAEPEAGRHTLRQTLWYIRRKLGFDPFSTTGDGVRLTAEISSDRDAFLAALDADNPELALQYYNGDFFPDFAAPGGAAFEHWADLERSRLRSLYLGAATRAVRDRLGKGRARDAVAIARRALDLAPRHQGAWRLILESYLAADDTIGATVELERLQRWLADDDLEPDPATAQLMKAVRTGRSNGAAPVTGEPSGLHSELVGRELEFAVLLAAFESAKRGQSRHVHLAAPAGLGKSRLLDGLAARLRSARVRVVSVRGMPGERALPYAFAAHLVAMLVAMRGAAAVSPDAASTLIALSPIASNHLRAEPDRSTGDDALRRRSLALTELVTTLAHDAPIVLLIDDVHWIDAESCVLLSSLANRAGSVALLLVTAARNAERFLEATPSAQRLTLTPLSVDDVGALVMSIARLPSEPWADAFISALHGTTRGSPLLVLETLQLMVERGQLAHTDGQWKTQDPAVLIATLGAGKALEQRIAALPAAARETLLRLAVAGTFVEHAALPVLFAQDGMESLAELEARGLITRADDRYRVSHDEIAAAAFEMAAVSDRARANAAVAEYLERTAGEDLSRLLRAGFHRSRVSDTAALDRVFLRAVRTAHMSGERSAIRNLGREVLGPSAAPDDVERLVARLPWRTRYRATWFLSGAIATLGLSILAALVLVTRRPEASVTRVIFTMDAVVGDSTVFLAVPDILDDLSTSAPVELRAVRAPVPMTSITQVAISGRLPDSSYVGHGLLSDDAERGMDIFRVSPMGEISVYRGGARDQSLPTMSPDGKRLAYATGALHPMQRAELMVYDVPRDSVYRITNSDDKETGFSWSSDGTRLAFVTSPASRGKARVCWSTIDASGGGCLSLPSDTIPKNVLGWRSDNELLVLAETVEQQDRVLVQFNIVTQRLLLLDKSGADYRVDPSGRLVLCLCRVDEYPDEVAAVFSPSTPDTKRVLQFENAQLTSIGRRFLVWEPTDNALSAVAIAAPDSIALFQRQRFKVRGVDNSGRPRGVPASRWKSLDPAILAPESDGMFLAKAPGVARIVVSAGGIISDTARIVVSARPAANLLREDWTEPLPARWLPFGFPAPRVDHGLLQPSGDDHLTSGIIGLRAFDAKGGIGMRARVRLPITASQWQSISIGLRYVTSDSGLAQWKTRATGEFSSRWDELDSRRHCTFHAPRGEGGEYMDLVAFVAAGVNATIPRSAPSIADGRWHDVTLQIFDDGRCALGIDGRAVSASMSTLPLDLPLRPVINGQSVKTTVEVGVLELWSGTRGDIDWTTLGVRVATKSDDRRTAPARAAVPAPR